jgi:hypothetical protein
VEKVKPDLFSKGPKSEDQRLKRAILAQRVAQALEDVVRPYVLPHPRLRERTVSLLSAALECSTTTIERLAREGRSELRDFSGTEVDWGESDNIAFAVLICLTAREEGGIDRLWREVGKSRTARVAE